MILRKVFYKLSPKLRFFARKFYFLPKDVYSFLLGNRNKYEPPKGDIYIGSGDFIKQGELQLELLRKHILIKKNDCVLDIGCGIGRTAVPLTNYLNKKGRYDGFDVVESGVKWCTSRIKKDFPNFNFIYAPLKNDLYNKHKKDASNFQFPYQNEQFDKVFLFSVFTHMQIHEIENYLKEIERVLKPNGLCLATFFIYDQSQELEILDRANFSFPIKKEGYRLMDKNVKSANVAIEDSKLHEMISLSGLTKVDNIEGYWKDNKLKSGDNDFQDIIVLQKKPL